MQYWTVIDEEYLDYLRAHVPGVPHSDYGANRYKPFFGVLFSRGEISYVANISHPQERHYNKRNSMIFQKIYTPDPERPGFDKLTAVVNLNFMIPVPTAMICPLQYANIDQYRDFVSEESKSKYIDLLRNEMTAINELNMETKAFNLYNHKINYSNDYFSTRCLDFVRLEELALLYGQTFL